LYKSYGQESCIRQGVFHVAPFDGLIFIYQTDPVGYASKRVFLKFIDWVIRTLLCFVFMQSIGQTLCSFEHVSCVRESRRSYSDVYRTVYIVYRPSRPTHVMSLLHLFRDTVHVYLP